MDYSQFYQNCCEGKIAFARNINFIVSLNWLTRFLNFCTILRYAKFYTTINLFYYSSKTQFLSIKVQESQCISSRKCYQLLFFIRLIHPKIHWSTLSSSILNAYCGKLIKNLTFENSVTKIHTDLAWNWYEFNLSSI